MHFGENLVILRTPIRRRQMGNREYPDPKRPHGHPASAYLCPKLPTVEIWTHMRASEPSWCQCNCNCQFAGAPQNDQVFTKMHQSAQNESKWPKMAKNRVKIVCTHFLDPPPSKNLEKPRFYRQGFEKCGDKTALFGKKSSREGPESACIRF